VPEAHNKKEADEAETSIRARLFKKKYGGTTKDIGFSDYVHDHFLPWSALEKTSYLDDVSRSKDLKAFLRDTRGGAVADRVVGTCENAGFPKIYDCRRRLPGHYDVDFKS